MCELTVLDPSETDVDPAAAPQKVKLFLIDGSGYIFRAYHALPRLTRKSDGAPVGAVAGFCNMLWKLICDTRNGEVPTHPAVIFDASEKTFRNTLYSQYKAHRPPAPEDLVPHFALVREATRAFGVPAVELNGFEADDLIASYAASVAERGGFTVKPESPDSRESLLEKLMSRVRKKKPRAGCSSRGWRTSSSSSANAPSRCPEMP